MLVFGKYLYFLQQAFDSGEATRYSVGLVVISMVLLLLLWLPDILHKS